MLHITCNMCTCDLPDMYALGLQAYISGKSLVPMLQLLHRECNNFYKMFNGMQQYINGKPVTWTALYIIPITDQLID